MRAPLALLALLTQVPGTAQSPLSTLSSGGSGNDSISAVALDPSGNIYVTGTTTSFDLPLLNPFQPANTGTQLVMSVNSGASWSAVSNPFPNETPLQGLTLAADPTNARNVYVASAATVCRSADAGQHFQCSALPGVTSQTAVTALAVDPHQPSTLYASASAGGGVFKSIDSGVSWTNASSGLPNGFADSLTLDPFHDNVIYTWVGAGGYVSQNGGASWAPSTLPWPSNTSVGGPAIGFTFDPVTPGIVYGPGFAANKFTIQKSVDAGQTWSPLATPFTNVCCVVAGPATAGTLYAVTSNPNTLWKSLDGGATWNSSPLPAGATGPLTIDPNHAQTLIASPFRSLDGGATWQSMNVSRPIQTAFVPAVPGAVYGLATFTSDAFLAEFLPGGKTLVFATYFGGMGNDSGNAIALDPAGNIWIAGSSASFDLPITAGAFQPSLNGLQNGFLAKFTASGQLLASTYLGGAASDGAIGLAISPQGSPWLIGSWTSTNFPFTSPATTPQPSNGYLAELDTAASQLLFSTPVDGQFDSGGKGIAIDPSGNLSITGSTYDANFPVTSGAFHNGAASNSSPKAFVIKIDSSGHTIYSTYFGGTHAPPFQNLITEGEGDFGVAAALDSSGNTFIAGRTSATDFPVTPSAYQSALHANCPYPAYSIDTGLIGTISTYIADDTFALKLDPLGTTALYSTYLGGSCYDRPTAIAIDSSGNAYITGETDSFDYPLLNPVEGAPATGQYASVVSVLNPTGSSLTYSTYLYAGSSPSIAPAPNGSVVVTGSNGIGAQSNPDYSSFDPFPTVATDGFLAILQPFLPASAFGLTQVLNAFSLATGPVAPGEIVALTLPGFTPAQFMDLGLVESPPFTQSLEGVQVTFDDVPVDLVTISAGKIVCIAPLSIANEASTSVQAIVDGAASNILTIEVAPTALGLLSADGSGAGLANARNADGTLNSQSNPAAQGSNVTIFLTGVGLNSGATPFLPMPGFIPGIFAYTYTVPSGPPQETQQGITLETPTSQSQTLFIWVN
jgi:hypothetical protein